MWRKILSWTNHAVFGGIVSAIVVWALTDVTIDTSWLMEDWQYDIVWFLVAIGWTGVSIALALFSKYLWDRIERDAKRYLRIERELRRKREKERNDREQKHLLAVKIWQECKDDAKEIQDAWESGNQDQMDMRCAYLSGKLQGLDPHLDDYHFVSTDQEKVWLWRVVEIINRTDASVETLDRIRKVARSYLEHFPA